MAASNNPEDTNEVGLAGLISGDAIKAVLRSRKKPDHEKTFPIREEALRLDEGWELVRRNKNTVRLRKPKPIGEQLEDRVWSLLAGMGFKYLSKDRNFKIPVDTSGSGVPPKQVDVFAADDETAIVVECKAASSPGQRSMQGAVNETKGLQSSIRQAINEGLPGPRRRVVFVYVTENIQWSGSDKARAEDAQISVIRDKQLAYYASLVSLIGPAARHQLQADLLAGSDVRGLSTQIPAVKGTFGNKNFYQFAIEPEKLLKLAYVSHRVQVDEETVGTYQRLLTKKRLKDIAQHIDKTGGIFPTNIVVNFRGDKKLRFDGSGPTKDGPTTLGTLYLPAIYKSAYLIDGQHRLYGFALSEWASKGRIAVLAFEGLEPAEEVRMFVEINSKQVKVPSRLLAELEPELLKDIPGNRTALRRIAARLVDELNTRQDSPLRGLIASEWDSDDGRRPITRPLLRNAIERSQLLGVVRGEILHPSPLNQADENATVERAYQCISGYLELFARGCEEHWSKGNAPGGFICTNNGLNALLRLFQESMRHAGLLDQQEDNSRLAPSTIVERTAHLTQPVCDFFLQASELDVAPFRREYGSGGQTNAVYRTFSLVHDRYTNFQPRGLEEFLRDRDQAMIDRAAQLTRQTERDVRVVIFAVLNDAYAADVDYWWPEAVPENIRVKAVQKMETSPERGDAHQYLDLLDYKVIAENSGNWQHFDRVLSFDPKARSKADKLAWFLRLNSIRNRVSHTGRDQYITPDEVTWLQELATNVQSVRQRISS